jgi:predicted exporter
MSWRRAAPWLWLLFVLAIALHQWRFWHESRLETDLFALLPADERSSGSEPALRRLADAASRQVVVLVGAPQWPQAQRAAERLSAEWSARDPALQPAPGFDAGAAEQAVQALRPWRDRLLEPDQVELLHSASDEALSARALAVLHQPGPTWRTSDWVADPLGLWPRWWARRAANNPLRPREGWLALEADGRPWIVLARQARETAFSMGGDLPHTQALDAAEQAARAGDPSVTVLRAGVPLHAEAAAAQGAAEINLIGWASLAAVLALVWAGFRSLRPMACVALSLLVGMAVALSVTAWVFGTVHLVTLVFGASLVGVAEDFGIHYFSSRAATPHEPGASLMRRLAPGMTLALATSVLGYAVMALVPFPGLRQMALFSAVGLTAAFVTVACWFPALAGPGRAMTPLAARIARSLAWLRWRPSLPRRATAWALCLAGAALLGAGLAKLPVRDDVRQLQSSPPALLQQQAQVQRLLRWPSPGQFFLVAANDEQGLLQAEQRLVVALAGLRELGLIDGWSALSDWVPPAARQREAAALTARAETAVLAAIGRQTGERLDRTAPAPAALQLAHWLAQPAATALRAQWLGRQADGRVASVVLISGLERPDDLPRVAAAARGVPGVQWVDRVAEVTQLLSRYRQAMVLVMVAGFAIVGATLFARYRRDAWRAWLPSALACVIALAVLGWLGLPMQLFNVLELIILLGIGVDYGIFLLEHRGDGSAWTAVVLGAASTWLAFGLLALSHTPALQAFGVTLLVGLALVALLAPSLRAAPSLLSQPSGTPS